jgi:hypothetical protein
MVMVTTIRRTMAHNNAADKLWPEWLTADYLQFTLIKMSGKSPFDLVHPHLKYFLLSFIDILTRKQEIPAILECFVTGSLEKKEKKILSSVFFN